MTTPIQSPRPWDILGLGTVVIDHLVTLPGALEPDIKHEVMEHTRQVGGPVPTALVLLRRWGLSAAFIGGWNPDDHGRLIEEDLAREGIDLSLSFRRGIASGFAHVWIDRVHATRTIAYHRSEDIWDEFDATTIPWDKARLIHLDGWPPACSLHAAEAARRAGCLVALDTGSVKPGLDRLIPRISVLNCARRVVRDLLGHGDPERGAAELAGLGPSWVSITDGRNGAWLFHEGKVLFQSAFDVKAEDTTGAGDTFAGALLYGVLTAWRPAEILAVACAAAALKCRNRGNRDALPSRHASRMLAGFG